MELRRNKRQMVAHERPSDAFSDSSVRGYFGGLFTCEVNFAVLKNRFTCLDRKGLFRVADVLDVGEQRELSGDFYGCVFSKRSFKNIAQLLAVNRLSSLVLKEPSGSFIC